MADVAKARDDNRKPNGKFGPGEQSKPEVTVNEVERLWSLEIEYVTGQLEVVQGKPSGRLTEPLRSDNLTLIYLIAFKDKPFFHTVEISLDEALADPGAVTGFHPVFDTNDDATTTVLGRVRSFV